MIFCFCLMATIETAIATLKAEQVALEERAAANQVMLHRTDEDKAELSMLRARVLEKEKQISEKEKQLSYRQRQLASYMEGKVQATAIAAAHNKTRSTGWSWQDLVLAPWWSLLPSLGSGASSSEAPLTESATGTGSTSPLSQGESWSAQASNAAEASAQDLRRRRTVRSL